MKKPKVQHLKSHPLAWKSVLWPHEELIRSMRRGRSSWPEIAAFLKEKHGITISYQSVRNFLVRASDPKRKRGRAKFDFYAPQEPDPSPQPAVDPPEEHTKKTRSLTEPEPENFKNLFPK